MMLPQRSIEHHATGLSEMLAVKPAYEDCAQLRTIASLRAAARPQATIAS